MHLMLHIFKKDVRRLWWAVAAALLLLAALAHTDRWRADAMVGATEGWLNLLLPLAWCCLIALVVNQEPLVDDREFWMTRPYRWRTLLGSKLLFVAVFIHVPLLIAGAAILGIHGFQPLAYLPQLLWKQIVLAAVLTVPAMALAALLKNLAQFLLAAIVILGAAAYLAGVAEPFGLHWIPPNVVRYSFAGFVLAAAACALLPIQYARRRTVPARIAGTVSVALAGVLLGYLPPSFTYRILAMLHPAHAAIAIRLASSPQGPDSWNYGVAQTVVALPLNVSGLPGDSEVQYGLATVEIVGPRGERYRTSARPAYGNVEMIDLDASILNTGSPNWLVLRLRPSVYARIKNGKVRVKGISTLTFYRRGETTWMPIGVSQAAPGAGRCSSTIVESPRLYLDAALEVLCESPNAIPMPTGLRLWQPETGRDWTQRLGANSMANGSIPLAAWLSPLDRSDTLWPLVPGGRTILSGDRWQMPRDALVNAKLAITPNETTAWAVVDFDFPDVTLSDYARPRAR